eukprot:SAG22_NODE_1320_length_4757_cov_28.614498_3_plen_238_part_00
MASPLCSRRSFFSIGSVICCRCQCNTLLASVARRNSRCSYELGAMLYASSWRGNRRPNARRQRLLLLQRVRPLCAVCGRGSRQRVQPDRCVQPQHDRRRPWGPAAWPSRRRRRRGGRRRGEADSRGNVPAEREGLQAGRCSPARHGLALQQVVCRSDLSPPARAPWRAVLGRGPAQRHICSSMAIRRRLQLQQTDKGTASNALSNVRGYMMAFCHTEDCRPRHLAQCNQRAVDVDLD